MQDQLDSTLDPINYPITAPITVPIYEDGSGFEQLREYNENATDDRILKQSRADFITTGLVSAEGRENELREIEVEANNIMSKVFDEKNKSIKHMTLQEILTNTSDTCIGIVTDLTHKPSETPWGEYIQVVLSKEKRYVYIGIILVVMSIWIYLMRM
jgi:hypothetical protein